MYKDAVCLTKFSFFPIDCFILYMCTKFIIFHTDDANDVIACVCLWVEYVEKVFFDRGNWLDYLENEVEPRLVLSSMM